MFEHKGEDGVWRTIFVRDEDMDEDDKRRLGWRREDAKEEGKPEPSALPLSYHDRNYNVFAILADVRNGRGFAGCETGEGFEPIAAGRGLPDDAAPEIRDRSDSYGVDGHSHTWVTLAEILNTEWQNKVTKCYGIVEADLYTEWRKENLGKEFPTPPDSYCGGIWGRDVVLVDGDQAERQIAATGKVTATHVRIGWNITYANCAKWFMEFIYAKVVSLGYDPNDVRMVMFYDN